MTSVTTFLQPNNYVNSGTTTQYSFQLLDLNNNPLGSNDVTAMTLSLIDTVTGSVVNTCHQINILNAGRGTLDVNGNAIITLSAADTAIFNTAKSFEVRTLVIDWTFGTKTGRHRVDIGIIAMLGVQPD